MNSSLNVLFIEDNPLDARLVQEELSRSGLSAAVKMKWVDRLKRGLDEIQANLPEAIILDLSLPDSYGLDTLERVMEAAPSIPVIVMTGQTDELVAMQAVHAGAQDYLIKGQVEGGSLARAIRYAIERKRVELQLRESTAIVEHSDDAIFRQDLHGVIRTWNRGAERIYGYRPDEITGRPVSILIDPDDAGQMEDILAKIRQGEKVENIEMERIRRDGTRVHLLMNISPIRDNQGKVVAASTIAHDITARKQAEAAVQEIQDRFRALTENAPDGVALVSPDGQIKFLSPAGRKIWGYDLEEEIEINPMERTHPDDLPGVFTSLARLVENPTLPPTLQYRFRRRDGSWVWIESTFTNLMDVKSVNAIVINFRDTTERKEAEDKIAFQASLLGAVGSAVIATDLKGMVLYWNPAAEKLYGWPAADALGQAITDLTPARQTKDQAREIIAELARGEAWSGEFLVQRRDGSTFPAFVSNSPIQDASGKLIGIIGVSSDITQLKQAEEALRESEHRFRALIENSADAIALLDVDSMVHFESPAATRILGYEMDELVGRHSMSLVHPDDIAPTSKLLGSLMKKPGSVATTEVRVRRKDGSYCWLEATVSNLLGDPDIQAIVVNYRDVTERRQAVDELSRLNERFTIAKDAAHLGVWDWDIVINRLIWDDQMYAMYGITQPVSILAYDVWLHGVHPEDRERADAAVKQALEGDGSFDTEFRVIWPDDSVHHLKANGQVIFGPDRRPMRMTGVNYDITERKQAELAVQEKVVTLQGLSQIQREISAASEASTILSLLCERLAGFIHVPKVAIAVRDVSSKMQLSAQYGLDDPSLVESEFISQWNDGYFSDDGVLRHTVALGEIPPGFPIMPAFRTREKIEAMAISPLYSGTLMVGALVIFDTQPRSWKNEELQMLDLLAGQAAIALEKIRLLNQEKQRRAELAALYHLSEKLGESNDFEEVLRIVVRNAVEVLHITFARVLLLEEEEFVVGAQYPVRELGFDPHLLSLPASQMPFTLRQLTESQTVLIDGAVEEMGEQERQLLLTEYARSLCLVPLKVRNLPLGVLVLGESRNQAREPISEDKLRLATSIAEQTSGAIQRTQLYKQTEQRLLHLQALTTIDQAISSSFDLRLVLSILTQQAQQQLEIDCVAAHLFNPIEQKLEYVAGAGLLTNEISTEKLGLGEGMLGSVALERRMRIEPDISLIHDVKRQSLIVREGFVSYCAAPLVTKGKLVGVLEAFHRSPFRFTQEWVSFYKTLAGQAGIAIDNAQLFESLQRSNLELERRVAERTAELNRTNAELEHASRAKDEFLATMSHELRTPLNSILGLSETLLEQRQDTLTSHQERSLSIIEGSGRHLLDLINDILDLSKIEAGKSDYYPQPLVVEELCRSSLGFIKSQAARKSISVVYENMATLPRVVADPRRLKQILVNLLTNAVKFTAEGGQVTLRVESDEDEDLLRFSVIDNGIGIAPEDLRRLFQPFVQVDSSLNREFEGTGLGLFLVQKLVDMHGGSIQVESAVGQGSCFLVNLPAGRQFLPASMQGSAERTQAATHAPLEPRSLLAGGARPGRILLAEDNMAGALAVSEYLDGHGYEVRVAHDGLEATQMAEEFNPDLILMDIQMPVMDGLEATRRLRALPRFRTTPIITLTALAMPGDRARCLEAGANEYVSKPVQLRKLLKTIEEMVQA